MATGSGKTWLAQQAISAVLARNQRAIYLAPLRALATELAEVWQRGFPERRVGIFTGDFASDAQGYPVPFTEAELLVMTPERFDYCTRAWRSHWGWIPRVDLVVVDEFHLLGDGRRGARLEGALMRFQRLNPFARLLCLSATLGNRQELANWLGAVAYRSDWRPVPLNWRVVRFRRAADKPELLRQTLAECTRDGGKSLVFVQSRRRAEHVNASLVQAGFRAAFHHAGLDRSLRRRVEEDFRARKLDVLVATSTLEMGLNLPARQVVLYDLQQFDGSGFSPLPVNNVWQRVGRAGRPGLDDMGEAVLLVPTWDRQADRYASAPFEPIRSQLGEQGALAEQIIIEISARYARTRKQIEGVFSRSLAMRQGLVSGQRLSAVLDNLVASGMIAEDPGQPSGETGTKLRSTPIGRVAVRHMLSPSTVLHFVRAADARLTFFDLLLLAACSEDCEPLLPVDFEELPLLQQRLVREPSWLLRQGAEALFAAGGISGRRVLGAMKMALAVRDLTRGCEPAAIASELRCYPFELHRLRDSVTRLLIAFHALAKVQADAAASSGHAGWESDRITLAERAEILQRMVATGLDERAVTLTRLSGIGGKLAARLRDQGIGDIAVLAACAPEALAPVRGISPERAARLIEDARLVAELRPANSYEEAPSAPLAGPALRPVQTDIDIYRQRRARELTVIPLGPNRFRVTGGSDPHELDTVDGILRCDCADFAKGTRACKHVLAVRRYCDDPELAKVSELQRSRAGKHQGLDVMTLWAEGSETAPGGHVQGWR